MVEDLQALQRTSSISSCSAVRIYKFTCTTGKISVNLAVFYVPKCIECFESEVVTYKHFHPNEIKSNLPPTNHFNGMGP